MAIAASPPRARTSAIVASSIRVMQSHSTLPAGVRTSSARWPIAKAGMVPMPNRSGSYCRQALT